MLLLNGENSCSEVDDFFRELDINGDGKLDYDEFTKVMADVILSDT